MSIKPKMLVAVLSPLFLLLLSQCELIHTTGPYPPPYSVEIYKAPQQLNVVSEQAYRFEARVSHPGGLEAIQNVWLKFYIPGTDTPAYRVTMLDDGGVEDPSAGDIQARDGVYTRVLYSATSPFRDIQATHLVIIMEAIDYTGRTRPSLPDTLALIRSLPPRILSVTIPDTLPSGTPQFEFTVSVSDSDGLEDVRWVVLEGIRESAVHFRDTLHAADAQAGTFRLVGDSTFAAEKQGSYQLRLWAEDRSGSRSDPVERAIYIENAPPHVAQTVMPDSLRLPPPGQQYLIRILAQVWDSQGLGDMRTVKFTVTKEGDSEGDPIQMFDDGNSQANGDDIAGDGWYSRVVTLNSNNQPGTYIFKFVAEDRVGQLSAAVLDTMVIVR